MKKLNHKDFAYNDEYVKAKKSMRKRIKESRNLRGIRSVNVNDCKVAVDCEMMYYGSNA